jgi:two-component system, LytTR family, response regulator
MISCFIVDDEPLARVRLRTLLAEADVPVEVIGESGSGQEALPLIHELKPDVVFLDIQMPVLDGFDVVELLAQPRPQIVFVTAYDEYALRAFEVQALDYLTKPVRMSRLNITLERLDSQKPSSDSDSAITTLVRERVARPLSRLTVHAGRKLRVVPVEEIRWIEAREKLLYVHLPDGEFRTDFTLDELEHRLDPEQFLRVHRSHIINARYARELVPWFAGQYVVRLESGEQLPVARRRVKEIKWLLGG